MATGSPLTLRQLEVLQCAVSGLSGKQIARALGISVRTVHEHLARMRQRLGAQTDRELIARAVASGLVTSHVGPGNRPAGATIGYVPIPGAGEHSEHEVRLLRAAGCERIITGADAADLTRPPGLDARLDDLGPGDVLVVPSFSHLTSGLPELVAFVCELGRRGAGFVSLHERVDTTAPGGPVVFAVFGALAGFGRELGT